MKWGGAAGWIGDDPRGIEESERKHHYVRGFMVTTTWHIPRREPAQPEWYSAFARRYAKELRKARLREFAPPMTWPDRSDLRLPLAELAKRPHDLSEIAYGSKE